MNYKSALDNLRDRLFSQPSYQTQTPKSSAFIAPQAPVDTRDSSDIVAISQDWVRSVKASSAESKARMERDLAKNNQGSGGFAEGFTSTLSKNKLLSKEKPVEEVKKEVNNDVGIISRPNEPVASAGGGLSPASTKPNGGYGDITPAQIEAMIAEEAELRGVDTETAVKIFRSEGHGSYQSLVKREGKGSYNGHEDSYGPFQLYLGGGLGNEYEEVTGRSLRSDNTPDGIRNQVAFALDKAVDLGWQPWYGRKTAGVGVWDGLKGAKKLGNYS